jgi:hypothetical protein
MTGNTAARRMELAERAFLERRAAGREVRVLVWAAVTPARVTKPRRVVPVRRSLAPAVQGALAARGA